MGFLRYLASLLAGGAVDAGAFALGEPLGWTGPLATRIATLLLGLAACFLLNEYGAKGDGDTFDRRRLRPTLVIATVMNFVLFVAVLSRFPDMQPLAALMLGSLAGILFAVTGYWRFFRRTG